MRSGGRGGGERRRSLVVAEGREAGAGRRQAAGRRHRREEERRRREAALVLGGEVHGERGRARGLCLPARWREEAGAARGIGGAPVLVHGGGARWGGSWR